MTSRWCQAPCPLAQELAAPFDPKPGRSWGEVEFDADQLDRAVEHSAGRDGERSSHRDQHEGLIPISLMYYIGTRWHKGLDWLPDEGVVLTRVDLERIFGDLRALIQGTAQLEPNRAHAVDIAATITQALERNRGDD